MISNAKIKELKAAKAKLARLEQAVSAELRKDLARLPASYGFDSVEEFMQAVAAASGSRRRGRPAGAKSAAGAGKGRKRHPRSVITDETRAQVKKLFEAGRTGAEIAKAVGISLPSVQNIKKALGLVRARK